MIELLLAGGPFMFAILSVSIITITIFIIRVIYLWGKAGRVGQLHSEVISLLEEQKVTDALRRVSADNNPMAKILKSAVQRADRAEKDIRRAVEAVAIEEIPKVRGSTVYLPQLSNLSTLLGLIGTIEGLITAFKGAGAESAAVRQEMLSRGIAVAFYNTFFGLVVATLGIITYLILLAKTNSILGHMERAGANVIDTILWSREKQKKTA